MQDLHAGQAVFEQAVPVVAGDAIEKIAEIAAEAEHAGMARPQHDVFQCAPHLLLQRDDVVLPTVKIQE